MMACLGPTPGQSLPERQARIALWAVGSLLIVPARPPAAAETTDDGSLASTANPFAISLATALSGVIGFDKIIEKRDSALVYRQGKDGFVATGFV
jgi:hypothetical protein